MTSNDDLSKNAGVFAIYTQIYMRMRRVAGRVIDASYMVENAEYAAHILALAKNTQDMEMLALLERLEQLNPMVKSIEADKELLKDQQPSEEEVYQRQVHHHYIGFLR